jgi:hypothetical protein
VKPTRGSNLVGVGEVRGLPTPLERQFKPPSLDIGPDSEPGRHASHPFLEHCGELEFWPLRNENAPWIVVPTRSIKAILTSRYTVTVRR